jgi:hypothetical protein
MRVRYIVALIFCLSSVYSSGQKIDWSRLTVKPYCIPNVDSFLEIQQSEVRLSTKGLPELDRLVDYLIRNPGIFISLGRPISSNQMRLVHVKGLTLLREYLAQRVGWDRVIIDRWGPLRDSCFHICTFKITE